MARQKARNLKNALDHATMYTTARACGILVHVYQYLATPLASKIRLVLLVVNSVRSHLTELKELSITSVRRCKHRYSTTSLQDTSQYLALFRPWSVLSLLAFRCCYCYHLNPARKQRPTAPKLDYDTWTPPRQVSGVGVGAGVRHRKPSNSVQAMLEKNGEHVTIQYNTRQFHKFINVSQIGIFNVSLQSPEENLITVLLKKLIKIIKIN